MGTSVRPREPTAPSFVKEQRERGRRSTAIQSRQRAAFMAEPCFAWTSARAGCLPCRGCGHIVSELIGPAPMSTTEPLRRRGPRASALRTLGAPLPTGVRARRGGAMLRMDCHHAQPRSPAPESAASFTARQTPRRYDVGLNRAPPLSRKAAQACRVPLRAGVRQVWGRAKARGLRFLPPAIGAACQREMASLRTIACPNALRIDPILR
jgi:hypothetical protein